MKMPSRLPAVALVALALSYASRAADPVKDFDKSLAILSAPGQTTLNRRQLVTTFYRCAVELKVQDRPMPHVVVISAGLREADVADVHGRSHIFINHHPESGRTTYMAWIVGPPRDMDLIEVFIIVLKEAFSMGLSDEQVEATVNRLYAVQTATVEVNSFLEKHK